MTVFPLVKDHVRFLKLLGYVAKGIQSSLFYPNPNFTPPPCHVAFGDTAASWPRLPLRGKVIGGGVTCPSCPYRKHCDAWQDA